MKKCEYHLEDGSCQLAFHCGKERCAGEENCSLYQLNAKRVCPSCNKKGASWSGYSEPAGFKYTCWNCGHTWTEPLTTRPETPGICLRCGREYETPFPEVVRPKGREEIATKEWCADCNKLAMSVIFREISAYRTKGPLYDPIRSGHATGTRMPKLPT